MSRYWLLAFAILCVSIAAHAADLDALSISQNIQARHFPFGTVLDPIYASSSSDQIVGYTRCGDSALWTGAYLAAESFRYNTTQAQDAFNNATSAISGLKSLVDVTGNDLLARCLVPQGSPFAAGIESEEKNNGVYTNSAMGDVWIGNTSRDEYVGAIFGLGVAYDMLGDSTSQSSISALVTRMVNFLQGHGWSILLPDGISPNTFLLRPDELLAILQVAKHVNPSQFSSAYEIQAALLSATITVPVLVDVASDNSYFKFNLDYMTFYNLIRLDTGSWKSLYQNAYSIVRNHTASHQNAFFDVVDRALNGPNASRDAKTQTLLAQWLERTRRDFYVDLSKTVAVCGSQSCAPIPVSLRVPTDFLWQRSPFQLSGGGSGTIETAGIDYILPYWMTRVYSNPAAFVLQSAAAAGAGIAPESLGAVYGTNLATQTAVAMSQPLPIMLGGVSVSIMDAAGNQFTAPLIYISPAQINLEIPAGAAVGQATFSVVSNGGNLSATAVIENVAPALFSASGSGAGVAAAIAIRTQASNPSLQSPVSVFECIGSTCSSVPIDLGVDTPVYVSLFGTGIRNRAALSDVEVTINGISVPVLYAGAAPDFTGLDQVNVLLTLNLRGSGEANVILSIAGRSSNTVTLNVQ